MHCDFEALAEDLIEIKRQHLSSPDANDFEHLKKLEGWVKGLNALGYASAWIAPNPLSAFLLSTSTFGRWAVLSHHISHKAYDRVPEIPERYTSKKWAKGWARLRDWMDWIEPEAWHEEHDILHHYRLGEEADPDLVELNLEWLRESSLPIPVRRAIVAVLGTFWKPIYYAPNAFKAVRAVKARRERREVPEESLKNIRTWLPWTKEGGDLWKKSWLPYSAWKFGAMPALFAPLGPWAVFSVWANTVMAEAMTNWHAFIVIVPNHAGDDVMRFEKPTKSKGEFFYRQIVGSVNYRTGGDINDFMHGWLNYQIEHHLFPTATPQQLQRIQPHVKAVCEKHGISYIQQPVFKRVKKLFEIMVGERSMLREPVTASPMSASAAIR